MKICTYNVENLFIHLDKRYTKEEFDKLTDHDLQLMNHFIYKDGKKLYDIQNKKLESLKLLAKNIKDINADVFGLVEVGGKESLNNFNKFFLEKKYEFYIEESNSDRGIYTAALVKKGVYSNVIAINHGKELNTSRNLMELKLYKNEQLVSIVLICHLKSHRGSNNGIDKRYEEVKAICNLYNTLKEENPLIPILWIGDFNGVATKGINQFEFDNIYSTTDLEDSLEIVNFPIDKRFTHLGFSNGNISNIQLDYMFISTKFSSMIESSYIYFYKDENNEELIPKNYDERRAFGASDHLPIIIEFKD